VPPIAIALIVFACAFSGALAGIFLRSALPEDHLSDESKEIVHLGMGLIATMTALVLGLMTASAKTSFDMQDMALKQSAADILTLDRLLSQYGPETKQVRDLIRRSVAHKLDAIWPEERPQSAIPDTPDTTPMIDGIENQILRLSPQDDAQYWLQSRALKLNEDVMQTRWLVLAGSDDTIHLPFLIAVAFWLTVIFGSFGLFAPRNGTVIAVLFVSAVSVASSTFLILEMDNAYEGLMKISSAPLRYTLAHLAK
jgi:hypothetical protein